MALYHVEVMQNSRSKTLHNIEATNPAQVVRKIAARLPAGSYQLFLVNDDGFGWEYGIMKNSMGRAEVMLMDKLQHPLNRHVMMGIRSGNKKISEVFG